MKVRFQIILYIGCFLFIACPLISAENEEITLEKILNNHAVLKEIAQEIFNQPQSIDAIISKLRAEHGSNAKTVWQTYYKNPDKSIVGNGKSYPQPGLFKDYIQQNALTYPQLQTLNGATLRDLTGKKTSTFYTSEEINNINRDMQIIINTGTYGAAPSGGQAQTQYEFAITYNVNWGEICTRPGNAATDAPGACQRANRVIIIFEAKQFFEDILKSQDFSHWKKERNLVGKFSTIK